MENCFFRAFEGETNNSNLPYYDRIRVEFVPAQSITGWIHVVGAIEVAQVENATVDSITLPDNHAVNFNLTATDASKPIVIWVPKYNLQTIDAESQIKAINIGDFKNALKLKRLSIGGIAGENNIEITGDLNVFAGKNMTKFAIRQARAITGDIANLSAFISYSGEMSLVSCIKVIGTIESLIEGLMSSDQGHDPMTSGSFTLNFKYAGGVTFHGVNTVPYNNNISVTISSGVATLTADGNIVATYNNGTGIWSYA